MPKGESKNKGVDFVTNLGVLESKGIDVILIMDLLSKHKVFIDYAKKFIKMTIPDRKELEYVTEPMVTAKGVVNRVKLNQLDASQGPMVPVVNEFFDVFPKELLGMPPDQDIEFVIDLMPRAATIYKRPYRMATQQLAKLKEHIKKLLEKGLCLEEGWYSNVVRVCSLRSIFDRDIISCRSERVTYRRLLSF
jgi:hypothetical protein